jgi:UDP-glucose 4-epimerase
VPELPRRVCVTGGAGFIGARAAGLLLTHGFEVVVLDNLSVGRPERVPGGARLVVGDIRDADAVAEAFNGCDAVLHLAARVAIRSSFEFSVEDGEVNYVGTASVLRGAHAAAVRHVIFASSMGVYADSPAPVPIRETHPTAPASPYGISKLAGESLVHVICARYGMRSTVLRLFNTFGPGQEYSPYVGVVTIFVRRLQAGDPVDIFGDGEQARDFVHVDDVAAAFVAATERSMPTGETLNVGSGVPTTVNQVYSVIQDALGVQVPPIYRPPAPGELRNSVADIGKARRLLGYAPAHRFSTAAVQVAAEIVGVHR